MMWALVMVVLAADPWAAHLDTYRSQQKCKDAVKQTAAKGPNNEPVVLVCVPIRKNHLVANG